MEKGIVKEDIVHTIKEGYSVNGIPVHKDSEELASKNVGKEMWYELNYDGYREFGMFTKDFYKQAVLKHVFVDDDKLYVINKQKDNVNADKLVMVPYEIVHAPEPSAYSTEYDIFMDKYYELHKYCPACGSEGHMSTLVGYILNMDHKEDYKDLNRCTCTSCGDTHTAHDRVKDK
jgi:hypothetical protein